ncbi:chloride channel protein [Pedobacter antarcticus]|uniref:chloride channel protein n=1 Tax=Pedobacter antarcticus TaxID=34086 RepID=UPI00088F5E02|nr:chloride channel protein [Pedobacter antarcticus]SDL53047.1 H+/Cl-antiporter ClcA [Pedobacter antarcticus]
MKYSTSKRIFTLQDTVKNPLKFNPFVYNKNFLLWTLLGIIGGIIAGGYWIVLEHSTALLAIVQGIYVIPLMTIAGLIAGIVIHKLGDPGEIDLMVDNIHFKGGRLDPKNNPSMILSSLICISAGGSLGPEAPLVQVVGSTGTYIARKLGFKGEDIRSITIAGMASAFTALFGAPLGGSLFALEILDHRHVTKYYKAFMPALVASCASYLVFILITQLNLGPTWNFPAYKDPKVSDIFYAVGYSLAGAATGWIFIAFVKNFKLVFKSIKLAVYYKLAIGGFFLGTIAYCIPLTRYFGHDQLSQVLTGNFTIGFLIVLLLLKLVAIAITVTSGWRGGFIIPLLFAGTVLGLIIYQVFPGQNLTLIAVCCMAALNACVTRTPVSIIILLATMTGFQNIAPIIFASLTGYFLSPKSPLISAQLGIEKVTIG